MSHNRLVEYFLVVGVDGSSSAGRQKATAAAAGPTSPPVTPLSPLSEHTARADEPNFTHQPPPDNKVSSTVLQRFPATDRKEAALPTGIEIFCQPLGWYLTYSPKSPSFVDFILTAEDSSRLYCTTLNFYQAITVSASAQQRDCRNRKGQVDYLDEGCEESLYVKDVFGELYEPVSLCLVSRLPLFELLQVCLKGFYVGWIRRDSLDLEALVAELLTDTNIPPINCMPVKKPLGGLKELVLPPIHEATSLPYTSTSALWLLKSVGVHQLLQLVSAIISDTSILFVSSSLTVLTSALRALCSIIHPFKISHSIVPVLPVDLLDYTQLPSTYIMGIPSSLRSQIDDELEVVEVYLDIGRVFIPDNIKLPFFPCDLIKHVEEALAQVLNPRYSCRDLVFRKSPPAPLQGKGGDNEKKDKKVRAIFICLMAVLLGDYQNFVTVLRFNPVPAFYLNMEAYLSSKESASDHQGILRKMAESISFFNFIHERSVPYRQTDFFDELVARFASNPGDLYPPKLFSKETIEELTEELVYLLPSCCPSGEPDFDLDGVNPEALDIPAKSFPKLKSEVIQEHLDKYYQSDDKKEKKEAAEKIFISKRRIPVLECTLSHQRQSSAYIRGLDSLTNCLDAMFQSKIIEARKYVPSVIQALKSGILSEVLVPALVDRFLQYGSLLSSEQFDLVVKLLNGALVDQQSAMMLLPLTTIIYREVNPGVQQYACTCVQNHYIWEKANFWRDAIYLAIQAELVRIYAEVETEHNRKEREKQDASKDGGDEPDHEQTDVGDITLRSRQRLRSSSPTRLRATLRASKMMMSRSARMRMRASVVVPGVSEGVLPPNAEPVTAQEALHHLAKILDLWDTLPEEKQANLMKMEENAITNQLILFVHRVINLRAPIELHEGDEEQFISDLEQFISNLLRLVEVDLSIDAAFQAMIRGQIHDMIRIHLDSMAGLRKELKRLPISKPKVIKPPLIPGEVLLYEHGVHAYLLQDGRDNRLMLPADGQVFLTSYRVIFLGMPCDPQAPSLIVTRSVPISSIYRLKKTGPTPLPQPIGINTVGGLQMRSVTAELLKIGFDDETSQMDIKNLEQHIVDLRNPSSITLGIKVLSPLTNGPDTSHISPADKEGNVPLFVGKSQFRNKNDARKKGGNVLSQVDTLTRVKLLSDISQSPCCIEYNRLKLGSVNFQDSKNGAWRVTTLNLGYAVCSSYPAVLVVPTKLTDDNLATLAGQFQHNRFPVVTWKHPKKETVLLRSSSFIPSSIVRKKFAGGPKQIAGDKIMQSKAGVGVYNADVENYFYNLVLVSPNNKSSLDLVQHISMPPPMMEFERYGSFRAPPSPSPSDNSVECNTDSKGLHKLRGRAASFAFKIRKRVGSSVSHISRYPMPEEKSEHQPSPAVKRKLTTKLFSSPQLTKRNFNEDEISRHSSCSTASDLSARLRAGLKEEPEDVESMMPRSANTSPTNTHKKKTHKRTRSSDQVVDLKDCDIHLKDIIIDEKSGSPEPPMSPIDWEAVGNYGQNDSDKIEGLPSRPSTSTTEDDRNSSPELLHEDKGDMRIQWNHFFKGGSSLPKKDTEQSPSTFSTLPTNPRDWMVMDALPSELSHWQANSLYIIGDKAVLQDIPKDLYPSCMFVPVEAPSPSEVSNSFKKLMRACTPSAPQSTFLSAIQDSGWITQLAHLMQLGGAAADLIDIQGSSVLICLENGWDATAQVASIAQILLDPYYRTIDGFKMLIEKDWLSFGHRFSHNGNQTTATNIINFTPIFLQFLDIVHQILKQFPLSFEFNDFFLRMMAYHHCSMRFHTFSADSEKERYANNWLSYRPRMANIHGITAQKDDFVSYWDHIATLHKDSMLFYNFQYQPQEDQDELTPLRPYSYQANMEVWSFYLDDHLSQFPSYDTELISDGPLTLLDMHHNFFEKEKSLSLMGMRVDHPGPAASEISSLLWQYTGLMNALAEKHSLPRASWLELLNELTSSSSFQPSSPIFPTNKTIVSHGQTLHKRTTMAVLIKGKLAVEFETQFTTPHQFEMLDHRHIQQECAFCKHQMKRRDEEELYKCKKCGCVCHAHCYSQMPYNCGQEKTLRRRLSKRKPATEAALERSNWSRHASSIFFNKSDVPDSPQVSEGYLYKRGKIVRNWKLRWFVLDTEKGELSYYDSNADSKLHGTIALKDILGVTEAEPQVVPALKPGESSFFFNVVTQKRVYHLMALRAAERIEWMASIKNST